MKNFTIIILLSVILGVGIYYFTKNRVEVIDVTNIKTPIVIENENNASSTIKIEKDLLSEVIGKTKEGREIVAYNYGTGDNTLLFVGGIHGGYSWNTTLTAYEMMDYLKANPNAIPKNIKVTVIPTLNPDGLGKVATTTAKFSASEVNKSKDIQISGRFNANKVDLNRNFDCKWKAVGKWQNKDVSGGEKAFSEMESLAIKNYVESNNIKAVVVWYSAADGVYSSNCQDGILSETEIINNLYAKASGYKANKSFDSYETSGDMTNWLASIKIPAISVLLSTHENSEWDKNKKGVEAMLQYYSK